jgi:hypothetical protein
VNSDQGSGAILAIVEFATHGSSVAAPEVAKKSRKLQAGRMQQRSLAWAIGRGAQSFSVAGFAAFSVWALGGSIGPLAGEAGIYVGTALVFLVTGVLFLHPLVLGPRSIVRFAAAFVPAFLAYAVVWCAAWFTMGFHWGEWIGALAGSVAFAYVAGAILKGLPSPAAVAILAAGNAAGYFLGGKAMFWVLGEGGNGLFATLSDVQREAAAKLAWGMVYGLGFGAGIGAVFHSAGRNANAGADENREAENHR